MIVVPRAAFRAFRAVLRRSVLAHAPRGPCPPVLADADPDGLVLRAAGGEVGLTLQLPNPSGQAGRLAFPGALLARLEGTTDAPVLLEVLAPEQGRARWEEHGAPQTESFTPVNPDTLPALREETKGLVPMPETFRPALDEACRTAARKPVRFALHRVQLRGRAGEVIATDGRLLLVQGGFRFPFPDDLLVPALPVFGTKELSGPLQLGMVGDHLVVSMGSWRLDLALDRDGRFPDVQAVLPRGKPATRLLLDDADASYLVDVLPGLPGADEEPNPVTLDLTEGAVVRSRDGASCLEVGLQRAQVTGTPVRLALDRKPFYRLLRLGFRAIALYGPDRPVVAQEGRRRAVLITLAASAIVAPQTDARRLPSPAPNPDPKKPLPTRKPTMNPTPANGQTSGPAATPDPLQEVEAIKAALQEALTRLGRLAGGLRQVQKQQRVVQSMMASLRQLHPSP